ncbi:hypothetical protein GCM10028801_41250 [Nocardioides maradonensis]
MTNQNNSRITVFIDGNPIGVFDKRTGGEVDADGLEIRHTGEGPKLSATRRQTYGDVVVTREYERERDHDLCRGLKPRAGRAQMVVSEQLLDDDGNAWGTPDTYTGILKTVNGGDADAASTDAKDLELTMVCKAVS